MHTHTAERLNEMAMQVAEANEKWWVDLHTGKPLERNTGEMLMLTVSELSEALEGHRKDLMDDKLPHRKMVEVELVDAVIRLMDMVGHLCPGGLQVVGVFDGTFTDNFGRNLLLITREVLVIEYHPHYPGPYSAAIGAILTLMDIMGYDFEGAWADKMAFNAVRHDHTREGRLEEHGKKY